MLNNNDNILTLALEYYDRMHDEYKKIFKCFKYKKEDNIRNDLHTNKIRFFNKKNKEFANGEVHIIGTLIDKVNIWIWAWAIISSNISKNYTYLVRNVLLFGLDWSKDNNNNEFESLIQSLLINSRIKLYNITQLTIIHALTLYILRGAIIYLDEMESGEKIYKIVTNIKKTKVKTLKQKLKLEIRNK